MKSSAKVREASRSRGSGWLARPPSPLSLLSPAGLSTALGLLFILAGAAPAAAQQGWNAPAALELVSRARAQRQSARGDSAFQSYSADARGYVYFYLDPADGGEPTLVKTDQVALEVYWKAPDSTRQRIVGLRDEEQLPTNIRYHLDHLTVVQDEFQDVIRLGDGDEVAAVVHPAAQGSEAVYDFRLADSVTIRFAGPQGSVQVYEVEVRPRDFGAPGFIGSVFIDRNNAAIVRMNFTFTPSSYVDDYLDYIRISLDNSLWDGRYWLPYEQRVELRRELPFLDFPTGTVIRGRYRIRGYEFNPELSPNLFLAAPVSALPRAQLRAFPFEQGLYDELDRDGLAPLPELAEIRAEAARMVGRRYLSGLARSRLWVPNASHALRYNRSEGVVLGLGGSFTPLGVLRTRVHGGFALGRERPHALVEAQPAGGGPAAGGRWSGSLFWNQPRDLGANPASSGSVNTLGGALLDVDYLDPFFASGARVAVEVFRRGQTRVRVNLGAEQHQPGSNVVSTSGIGAGSDLSRGVPQVTEGWLTLGGVEVDSERGLALRGRGSVNLGHMRSRTFTAVRAGVTYDRAWMSRGLDARASVSGGWTSASAPPQTWVLVGGRGTLPGQGFHGFQGDRHLLANAEVTRDVALPWIRLSATAHAARTWLRSGSVPVGWPGVDTNGTLFSLGAGARLLWDAVRLDLSRGLSGGHWEVSFSVSRRFHPWL